MAPTEYIRWVDHQAMPTVTLETTVGMVTTTARLISGGNIMFGKIPVNVLLQNFRGRRHRKGLAR